MQSILTNRAAPPLALGCTVLMASSTYALTSNFTATVNFTQPFTVAESTQMTFGTLIAGVATSYVITTASAATSGAGGGVIGGAPAAGDFRIDDTGTATTTLSVVVNNLTADNGVTPTSPTCAYNGGGELSCAAPITGLVNPNSGTAAAKTLLVGMTLVIDGTQADGTTASPSYDVVVQYD